MAFSDWEALLLGIGTGLASITIHTVVHTGFISVKKMVEVGAIQANLAIFATVLAGIYLMNKAVQRLQGIKLFLAAVVLWFLPAIGHDGTHLLYIPLEEVTQFGLWGVPESGIAYAIIYTAGLIYIYLNHE